MVRIAGVDLPVEKRIDIGLTVVYGVGRKNVMMILKQAGVKQEKRIKELTGEEISRLQEAVEKVPNEGTLRQKVADDVKRLKMIGSYRGIRHARNLPVRGQRTRSNARTKRGKRQTVGALKKEDRSKLEQSRKSEEKTNG